MTSAADPLLRPLPLRLPWAERGALREALREHPLVHLAAPELSPGQLMGLAEGLGEPDLPLRVNFRLPEEPRLLRFSNRLDERGGKLGANAIKTGWHLDASYRSRSPHVSLLYAVAVPPSGGDTHFKSLYRLYEQFGPAEHAAWQSLVVEHEAASDYFDEYEQRITQRPLIRRHPDSGRPLLLACPAYAARVLGMPVAGSRALLDRIAAACDPPDHVHRWRPHDLLVWDNEAMLQRATPFDTSGLRELWRAQVFLTDRD